MADIDTMEYITFASLGNSADFGNLAEATNYGIGAAGDGTKGLWGGGQNGAGSQTDAIQYVNMDSLGNTTDFGDLSDDRMYVTACGDGTKCVFGGGVKGAGIVNILEYVNFASTGNVTDFGDLNASPYGIMAASGD